MEGSVDLFVSVDCYECGFKLWQSTVFIRLNTTIAMQRRKSLHKIPMLRANFHSFSDVHPSEPVIRTATAKIFDKSNFLPPKNSLLSIKSEKDIQNLNVKELKVSMSLLSTISYRLEPSVVCFIGSRHLKVRYLSVKSTRVSRDLY